MFKKGFFIAAALALGAQLAVARMANAAPGDFSFDLTAAAPLTYDHTTGGGAYNDRTIGIDKDVVESLEGGNFACNDIVTYLTQIRTSASAFAGEQTIELLYNFTAYSTGQQGVALVDVTGVSLNGVAYNGTADSGTVDDGDSHIVATTKSVSGPLYTKPSTLSERVRVDGLGAGDNVVLRVDVRIGCNGQAPTGNMQAVLAGAAVVAPPSETGVIPAGAQTVPFKHVNQIKK
jgi:hypothetical protein